MWAAPAPWLNLKEKVSRAPALIGSLLTYIVDVVCPGSSNSRCPVFSTVVECALSSKREWVFLSLSCFCQIFITAAEKNKFLITKERIKKFIITPIVCYTSTRRKRGREVKGWEEEFSLFKKERVSQQVMITKWVGKIKKVLYSNNKGTGNKRD